MYSLFSVFFSFFFLKRLSVHPFRVGKMREGALMLPSLSQSWREKRGGRGGGKREVCL